MMRAFTRAQQLLEEGDSQGARAVFEAVLTEEPVPYYRETVEEQMRTFGL